MDIGLNGEEFGRIDGVIRKIAIGDDIRQRIVEVVGGGSINSVSRISFDKEFLEKHGKVRVLIMTKIGEDEKVWKQIIDNTVIEYDLSNTKNKQNVSKHTGKHTDSKSGSKAGTSEAE